VSYEITKRLAKNHTVLLLAHKRLSDANAKEDSFPVLTASSLNIPRTNFWVYFYLFSKRRLVEQSVKGFKPDVIYAHNPYDTYVSHGANVPVVSHIHSLYTEYFMSQESSRTILPERYWKWFWKYRLAIERNALSKSRLVITYSNFLADLAKERGAKSIEVIPNGIDASVFNPSGSRSTEFKKPAVVYVGRIEKAKGIAYLLKAAEELPDVNFYLIGEAKDEYALPANVHLVGKKDPESIPVYLRAADIFLNPVVRDGFEIVNMEAMACEVPVITTNAFERTELYKESAILVRPEDSQQIVAAIRKLLSDTSLRLDLVRKGKLLASQHDWSAIASLVEICLARVAAQHDSAGNRG